METLSFVIISGLAVAYTVELLAIPIKSFFNEKIFKNVLTLPFSFIACWFLGLTGFELVVASLAAGFFSTASLLFVNRPASIQTLTSRR